MLYLPARRSWSLRQTTPALLLTLLLALVPLLRLRTFEPLTPPFAAGALSGLDQLAALRFTPNLGQTDPAVRFQATTPAGAMFFTADGITLAGAASVRLGFNGANPAATITGAARQPGVINDLRGSDPAQWRTNLPTYASLIYHGLYPGIDLRYDGADSRLKGTYTVAPGADPRRIRWSYQGATSTRLDRAGNLIIELNAGRMLTEAAPVAWQEIGGRRAPVTSSYALDRDGGVSFALGRYDPEHALIIDPTLSFSSLLGGNNSDGGRAIGVDGAGNIYIGGTTDSYDLLMANALQPRPGGGICMSKDYDGEPIQIPCTDVFVAKLDATTRTLVYSTYLGGEGDDWLGDLAVDSAGNVYLTGNAGATFPTTPGAFQTAVRNLFVAKLNVGGSALAYSTYFGSSGYERSTGIAVDSAGNAYVTGITQSPNFPTRNPLQAALRGGGDAFLAKFNPSGSALVYSTYLGGNSGESGESIAVDSAGNAYLTGATNSADFPTRSPLQPTMHGVGDGFVTKINASGSALVYSTYLGGSASETPRAIAVDSAGNAYLGGVTRSADFPAVAPTSQSGGYLDDGFVAKINAAGSALVYSRRLGGSDDDSIRGLALDSAGNAYITGMTSSPDFPTAAPWQPSTSAFSCDPDDSDYCAWGEAFVTKLGANGRLEWSSYLGGRSNEAGTDIAIDRQGAIQLTGNTSSRDFPLRHPLPESGFNSNICGKYGEPCGDAFVASFNPAPTNFIVNGGFEADSNNNGAPDAWSSNSRASRSNAAVHSGSYALRHHATDNDSYTIYSDAVTPIIPGFPYSFTGWVNIPATSDAFSFELQVRWRDAGGNVLSTVPINTYTAATSGWVPLAGAVIAPPNAAQATIRQVVSSLNATVYVDDLTLRPIGNILINGGFEGFRGYNASLIGWSSNSHVSRSYLIRRSGDYALQHQASDNASYTIYSDPAIPEIRPGETYVFSAWTNIPATSDAFSFEWQVRWRDSGGNVLGTVPVTTYTAATNGWTSATATLVAPPNAAHATIRQIVGSLNATVYVDDVRFGQ